jgi:hypothetical protein
VASIGKNLPGARGMTDGKVDEVGKYSMLQSSQGEKLDRCGTATVMVRCNMNNSLQIPTVS